MTGTEKVGTEQFLLMFAGAALFILVPLLIAIIWKVRKKERFTTILIGAATFMVFAVILEKIIQNVIVFPTAMGLPDNPVSIFLSANPILLSIVAGLFPGVFEETGRLVAFRTVLRKRRNRETAISYGIGHGGFEVMFILGTTFIEYIAFGLMINNGTFQTMMTASASEVSGQLQSSIDSLAYTVTSFSFNVFAISIVERVFAFLFHVGASIIVFYAARDKKFWLYPLAILLHTVMDTVAALSIFKVIDISSWALEAYVAAVGLLTFFGAYCLLYRRDREKPEEATGAL